MHKSLARTSLWIAVLQVPTSCFEGRFGRDWFPVFIVGRGSVAGGIGVFLAFGEPVFLVADHYSFEVPTGSIEAFVKPLEILCQS